MDFSKLVKKNFRRDFEGLFIEVESLEDRSSEAFDDGRRFVETGFYDENPIAGIRENLTRLDFCYNPDRNIFQYVDLFVLPCKRSWGLGSRLVEEMESVAILVDCHKIEIDVKDTSEARYFWNKRGYFPIDAVYWNKLL
jgi:GNAT superfamily N-acetyltransferase